ncbi:MAG: rhodanese-like domain-containing protein [Acidimicrobiales bacterium]
MSSSSPDPELGPAEALVLVDAGAVLLDVREDDEWAAGHAPQALHIPMGQILDRLESLPGDRPVICVCHRGGRSARVVEALRSQHVDARNLGGGMDAWAEAGLDVVDESGAPGVVLS